MKKLLCDFDDCRKHNEDTYAVIRDLIGVKVLCQEHYGFVSRFFQKIAECARMNSKDEKCLRNHGADYYSSDRKENTLRFDGKYFDLCPAHLRIYERCFNYYVL